MHSLMRQSSSEFVCGIGTSNSMFWMGNRSCRAKMLVAWRKVTMVIHICFIYDSYDIKIYQDCQDDINIKTNKK